MKSTLLLQRRNHRSSSKIRLVHSFVTLEQGEEAYKLLKEMKFSLSFTWLYDPLGVISRLRVENKFTPYHHTTRPEIEQYKNLLEWKENTLQEVEEHAVYTSTYTLQLHKER